MLVVNIDSSCLNVGANDKIWSGHRSNYNEQLTKRKYILIINTLSIIAAIAIGTLFLQIMVMLGGYLPIIELGNVN